MGIQIKSSFTNLYIPTAKAQEALKAIKNLAIPAGSIVNPKVIANSVSFVEAAEEFGWGLGVEYENFVLVECLDKKLHEEEYNLFFEAIAPFVAGKR